MDGEGVLNPAVALNVRDIEGALMLLASQPMMGSSRISGGILRGHAWGNTSKHADIMTTNELETPVKGEVHLSYTLGM